MISDHSPVGEPGVDVYVLVDVAQRSLYLVLPEARLGVCGSFLLVDLRRLPLPARTLSLPPDDLRAVLSRESLGLLEVEYLPFPVPRSLFGVGGGGWWGDRKSHSSVRC